MVNLKTQLHLFFITLLTLLSIPGFLFSQPEIEFTGYGATGFRFYDRNRLREINQEVYYEGKFQTEIKINKDLETQLDFRGNSEDNTVVLREFSIKSEHLELLNFEVGNIKKPFGLEQLISNEDLSTIDESYMLRTIEDFGYGGRSVSLMGYYKYNKKKREDFPYSYYVSLFKDNSLNSGLVSRFSYHNNNFRYSVNYLFQHKGGEQWIDTYGFGADIQYENGKFFSSLEANLVQDPVESVIRRIAYSGEKVFAGGVNLTTALAFDAGSIIKSIEPVILLGFYSPDTGSPEYHTIQTITGVNLYLHKDVRVRLNGDVIFKKNRYNNKYSTIGSKFIIEFQARF